MLPFCYEIVSFSLENSALTLFGVEICFDSE